MGDAARVHLGTLPTTSTAPSPARLHVRAGGAETAVAWREKGSIARWQCGRPEAEAAGSERAPGGRARQR